jgi:CrcB protein
MVGTLLQVAAGGAVGAAARHLVNAAFMRTVGPGLPWATLAVNVAGSFLMGVLVAVIARRGGHHLAPFVMTGFLGAFTTFSAFSLDVVTLYERGAVAAAAAYAAASVVLSVAAVIAALWVFRGGLA